MIALHDAGPQDVVVFFGLTLTFRATLTVLDFVHSRGTKTIAIIGSPVSLLQTRADLVFAEQGPLLEIYQTTNLSAPLL